MLLLLFEGHFLFSRSDGHGGTLKYYYYDRYTWIIAAFVAVWLTWLLVSRALRARRRRRPPRNVNHRRLKRLVKIKRQLSSTYLRPNIWGNIHAVGIGRLDDGRDCLQIFINDPTAEPWPGAGAATLPNTFRGIPVVQVQMPVAGFITTTGIRDQQDVIIGGISGANTNLFGESGTIGYFCTRKTKFRRHQEIHLLSNSHVFADLRKEKADDTDLIVQPSPGEAAGNRPIGTLVNFSTLKFETDLNNPNHVDAAIAKLWRPQPHKPVIPSVGAVKGHVIKSEIEVGEAVRKFGRTTGYTEGHVFSIYLDIWIRYDRTGKSAFFPDQILVAPSQDGLNAFAAKGDSGSLLVDANQYAVGLIFAGMTKEPVPTPDGTSLPRIEGYGVANPIDEVLNRLKIELLI